MSFLLLKGADIRGENQQYTKNGQDFLDILGHFYIYLILASSYHRNNHNTHTVCPGSSDPFCIVSYYIKWGHYFLDTQYSIHFIKRDETSWTWAWRVKVNMKAKLLRSESGF